MNNVYVQNWLEQPKEIRDHLAKVFFIPRTGIAEIRDQHVVSDGYTNDDLRGITQQKMSDYIGSDGEFSHLWRVSVSKAKYELHPPEMEITTEGIVTEIVPIDAVPIEVTPEEIISTPEQIITKFCPDCDSKGGRHLKVCPNFK